MVHLQRLIVFDLDGTLIDSRHDLADAANQLVKELGGTPLALDTVTQMIGGGAEILVRQVLHAAGLPSGTEKELERFLQLYDNCLLNHTCLYPGLIETLVQASCLATLSLLTNKPSDPSERILRGLGIRRFFDQVIGGDSPWPRKPDPTALFQLMATAGTDRSRTLLIGDSCVDLETARQAEIPCCLVSYGFGFQGIDQDRLDERDFIAADAVSLAVVIKKFIREFN